MASSSTSGNSLPAIIEASDTSGRISPPLCLCAHENYTSAGVRYLDSSNLQRHIHENMNTSRPLKFVADSNGPLQRSKSSGSFNKLRHLGHIAEMQKSRNQNIGSLMTSITNAKFTSAASPVNKMIAPIASSPTTTTVNRFFPYAFSFSLCAFIIDKILTVESSYNYSSFAAY